MPIVPKKSVSSTEKTNGEAVTTPAAANAPVSENWPRMLRSGVLNHVSGKRGTLRAPPTGLFGVSGFPR